MTRIIKFNVQEKRRDKRRQIERLKYLIDTKLVELQDISIGGFRASNQISGLIPNKEVSIRYALCDRNIVKKIKCPFDVSNGKSPVTVNLDLNARSVQNYNDGSASFRFVRLTSEQTEKVTKCVVCGLNNNLSHKKTYKQLFETYIKILKYIKKFKI